MSDEYWRRIAEQAERDRAREFARNPNITNWTYKDGAKGGYGSRRRKRRCRART